MSNNSAPLSTQTERDQQAPMYSAEHEARVAAAYLDLSPFHFHDCCGSLRIVVALQNLTIFPWKKDADRIVEYLTPEQARVLRDKLNEWYPHG